MAEKKAIKLVIGRETSKGCPGMLGRGFDYKPGDSFHTSAWFYPGEPYEKGSIGALMGHVNEKWSFWTGWDIDFALIFDAEDVREVVIPNDPETAAIFKDAPFTVTIDEGKS